MDHLFGSLSFFVHNQLFQLANEAWNPRAKLLPVYLIFFVTSRYYWLKPFWVYAEFFYIFN